MDVSVRSPGAKFSPLALSQQGNDWHINERPGWRHGSVEKHDAHLPGSKQDLMVGRVDPSSTEDLGPFPETSICAWAGCLSASTCDSLLSIPGT